MRHPKAALGAPVPIWADRCLVAIVGLATACSTADAPEEPVDLSWRGLRDESTSHRYDFLDGFTLDPGESVRVLTGFGCGGSAGLNWRVQGFC